MTRLFGDRNYRFVYPEGVNFANFSMIVNNSALVSWGWSNWLDEGEELLTFKLNSTENITMRFFFTQEDSSVEFEAQWNIAITEVEDIKKYATDLRKRIFINFIAGGILIVIEFYLPDWLSQNL